METKLGSITILSIKAILKNFYIIILKSVENDFQRLKLTANKGTKRKLVNFQVFPNSAHQAELERYQGHIKLDDKYPFHGVYGELTYDLHDKNWKALIGINTPS